LGIDPRFEELYRSQYPAAFRAAFVLCRNGSARGGCSAGGVREGAGETEAVAGRIIALPLIDAQVPA
jgi:hypothetical protein